jgi:hypothetical protein
MSAPSQCLNLSCACNALRLTSNLPIPRPHDGEHSIDERDAAPHDQGHHGKQQVSPLQILCRTAELSSKHNLDHGFEGFKDNNILLFL